MSRELDEQCAQAMGWKLFEGEPGYGRPPSKPLSLVLDVIPAFSADHAAARLLEDEIERRNLQFTYVLALNEIANPAHAEKNRETWVFSGVDIFLLIRATPEQRARAFIAALNDPA